MRREIDERTLRQVGPGPSMASEGARPRLPQFRSSVAPLRSPWAWHTGCFARTGLPARRAARPVCRERRKQWSALRWAVERTRRWLLR